jgi:branched-chain amino acid transport system substrate-binding protein
MEKAGSTDGAAMAKVMEDNTWDLLTGKLDWEPADKGHETHKQAAMVKLTGGKPEFLGWLMPDSQPLP